MRPYLVFICLLPCLLLAQTDEDILFTVAGEPVTVGEFRYIYTKTNGEEADFSRQSILEYLDLYERFKLKVARARQMGLDTVVALQNELEGYRKQLAESYLTDREVLDPLVTELHARKARDIDFSHLLVAMASERPADTLAAYRRALEIRNRLTPQNFATLADSLTDDRYSKGRGGRIGYVSAPLPRGMYPLEQAMYEADDGEVVGPVRSPAGYHLLLRHADRPAYGEMEVAHILVRKQEDRDDEETRAIAEDAYAQLEAGTPFGRVAQRFSEDSQTKNQEGYIGYFGINRYNKEFEQAAFGLDEDDEVSEIVESPAGFHIIKRLSRREARSLEEDRPLLEAAVRQDPRYATARRNLLRRLRTELDAEVMEDNYTAYAAGLDSAFFDPRRKFSELPGSERTLLRIGEMTYTGQDYAAYLARNVRLRASLERRYDAPTAARELFEGWVDSLVQTLAEARLEEQYPDFRALMREYREGILLFEATKLEVWDRAGQDTAGLRAFFTEHRDDYTFGPRARVLTYYLDTTRMRVPFDRIQHFLRKGGEPEEFAGDNGIEMREQLYEEDRLPAELDMEVGSSVELEPADDGTDRLIFQRVAEIVPPRRKELDEARGYVIADYQDQLEREWVEELRQKFAVERNEEVLEEMIREM